MMRTMLNIKPITAILLLAGIASFAQVSPEMDSILKQAKLDIYENPAKVIRVGDSIYNNAKSTVDERVEALMLISDAYSSRRDYQKSLKYFKIANDLSRKENNIKLQIVVLGRTAVRYQQMKVYDKAIECLDECDRLIADYPSKTSGIRYTQATNYVVRGFIYKEQLNCDIAISYFDKGIAAYNTIESSVKKANISIAKYNKGNCLVLLSRFDEAKKSYTEAADDAESVNANSLKGFALKGLSEVYNNQKEYAKAIGVLQEALDVSKDVGDLVLNRGLYMALSNNYYALNDWEAYKKYNSLYMKNQAMIRESERVSINDSIDELTILNSKKQAEMETKYYIIISVLSLLIITFLLLLYRYQKRSLASVRTLNLRISDIKKTLHNNSIT